MVDSSKRNEPRRTYSSTYSKPTVRGVLPLPAPPRDPRAAILSPNEDKYPNDNVKLSPYDDRLQELRKYRRARGLCEKCAAKWRYGHKCDPEAQLHAMQEVWELLVVEDQEDSECDAGNVAQAELAHMVLSQEAAFGKMPNKAMQFQGCMQGKDILILVDSGSLHTFIGEHLSKDLQGIQPLASPMQVKVANGDILGYASHILVGQWSIQNCTFVSDVKILPLPHYDMIVGMDWLEAFSPMKVDVTPGFNE